MHPKTKTIFAHTLSDITLPDKFVSMDIAEQVFDYFNSCSLFRWRDANNDCEDRANAICMVLDKWNIPNYKGWAFSGYFLKKENGSLINSWNYHVAPLLPVKLENEITYYIIDPATATKLITLEQWADTITHDATSYYVIKESDTYIFSSKKVKNDNWYKRNKRNYRWTMQGLSGINGVSVIGKAHLCFNKHRVKKTEQLFKKLINEKPTFLANQLHLI